MRIGAGLDGRLGLRFDELREAGREAARSGFESLWTPGGGIPEHPVQALGPGCAHKSFREHVRPRRPNGGLDDLGAGRAQDLVEGPDELCISVTDKEADCPALVFDGRHEVPGLLGDQGSDGVGRHAGQEDFPTLQFDEEKDIDAAEHHRVDVEKVAGEGAGGLGSDELRPRWPRWPRRGTEPMTAQHVAHAGGRDGHTEFPELADDTEIAPARVLPGHSAVSHLHASACRLSMR